MVTGASRGIGREISLALAAEGAKLALVGRDQEALAETARLTQGANAKIFKADLRDEREIGEAVHSVHQTFQRVDVLVNAAGVWHDAQRKYQGPQLPDTPAEEINEVIEVGLRSAMLLSRLVLPGMIQRKGGKILQISCGFAGPHEARGWIHYYVT
ncbi:MAG: SDR family oxidoreductase, partial [Elusimicrobia bacterium]|nr:SDR family oxidoreductase [Elusimicrobiota bacterium]